MIQFLMEDKTVSVYPSSENNRPAIYLNTFAEEGEQVYEALRKNVGIDFTLAGIRGLDWNHDMAPWDIAPISKNDTTCTAGTNDYLQLLREKLYPKWKAYVREPFYGEVLRDIRSRDCSPSIHCIKRICFREWQVCPGFLEYVLSKEMKRKPDCLYLSLDNKESKT